MGRTEAALGFRAHSGWAVMVAAAGGKPVLRRRIEMIREGGFRANQPYHAAADMPIEEAAPFLKRTEEDAIEMAAAQIREVLSALAGEGYGVRRAAVLLGAGKPLPDLPKILAAHPLIHTAEGVFFRHILTSACERCGLKVAGIRERDLPADLVARMSPLGKVLGPPWTQDEKLATAAAAAK
ncbi:MAG TPA: hypothetical protein VMH28_29300 [Candidatus Acidoferrales bacterium]|nr:hypothetical protein [Candidatus Acidoferrales bacterium]